LCGAGGAGSGGIVKSNDQRKFVMKITIEYCTM